MSEILMEQGSRTQAPLDPPEEVRNLRSGGWRRLSSKDPILKGIREQLWADGAEPHEWEIARFSKAVYLIRESLSRWTLAVKYYSEKTGSSAQEYSERELSLTQEIRGLGFDQGPIRVVTPHGAWRGVLMMERVEGITLADAIATRGSMPGFLHASLNAVARLLARLHEADTGGDEPLPIRYLKADALEYIDVLEKHGVLKEETSITEALRRSIERWAVEMERCVLPPARVHGDATVTNYMFPSEGEVVAIDWERAKVSHRAFDLGRLSAEIVHSVKGAGGSREEGEEYVDYFLTSYMDHCSSDYFEEDLHRWIRFHRAISMLRIARNGWEPRLERMTLVAGAIAILADMGRI